VSNEKVSNERKKVPGVYNFVNIAGKGFVVSFNAVFGKHLMNCVSRAIEYGWVAPSVMSFAEKLNDGVDGKNRLERALAFKNGFNLNNINRTLVLSCNVTFAQDLLDIIDAYDDDKSEGIEDLANQLESTINFLGEDRFSDRDEKDEEEAA